MLAGARAAQVELAVGALELGQAARDAGVDAAGINTLGGDFRIGEGNRGRFLGDGKAILGFSAHDGNIGLAGGAVRVFIGRNGYLERLFLAGSPGPFRVKMQPGSIAFYVPGFRTGETDGFFAALGGESGRRGNLIGNLAGILRPGFLLLLLLAGEKQPCAEGEGCQMKYMFHYLP